MWNKEKCEKYTGIWDADKGTCSFIPIETEKLVSNPQILLEMEGMKGPTWAVLAAIGGTDEFKIKKGADLKIKLHLIESEKSYSFNYRTGELLKE